VKAIAEGKQEKLVLGNLDIWRDWGWAPEYVEAMHLMVQAEQAQDYVIASGMTHSLREFVDAAFEHADLNSKDHLEVASSLMRPSDLGFSSLDPSNITRELHWRPRLGLGKIVEKMSNNILY
jgi:GDPmannose 4,6-dehydratase